MHFDLSAARLFQQYLDGGCDLEAVLRHPAYQAVFSHAAQFGGGLAVDDVVRGIDGEETPFYGLKNVRLNRKGNEQLLSYIESQATAWEEIIQTEIERLVPTADLSRLTIYPIIGYDAGIGHDDCVCMNINRQPFWDAPLEFLYLAIHESFHSVYEHMHRLPRLSDVREQPDRLRYFYSMVQNEGLAVYAPLRLRLQNGDLSYERHPVIGDDYRVLLDEDRMQATLRHYQQVVTTLKQTAQLPKEQYLQLVFGPERITYRVGCRLAQLIEQQYGLPALRAAVRLPGEQMVKQYAHLLPTGLERR